MQSSTDAELSRVRAEFAAYRDTKAAEFAAYRDTAAAAAAATAAAAAAAAAATAHRLHSQQVCLQAALRLMCQQALGR